MRQAPAGRKGAKPRPCDVGRGGLSPNSMPNRFLAIALSLFLLPLCANAESSVWSGDPEGYAAPPGVGFEVPDSMAPRVSTALHAAWTTVAPQGGAEGLELIPRLVLPWPGGTKVRFAFRYHGLIVDGREVRVALDREGEVRRTRGVAPAVVEPELPRWGAGDAADRLEAQLVELLGSAAPTVRRATLVWHEGRAGALRLAWRMDAGAGSPGNAWRGWVDAGTGRVLAAEPTSRSARANVYPENPETTDLTDVELAGLLVPDALRGDKATVWSCDTWESGGLGGGSCADMSRHAAPDGNGDYYFEPNPTSSDDPLAELQMYYHLDVVARWFETTLGFGHDEAMKGIVNFDYDNAFYGDGDGDGDPDVSFGQARGIDFAYDGDVVYHEFGHSVIGVVAQTIFLGADEFGLEWANGSLNEGSADLFSVAITGDPTLGEYAAGNVIGSPTAIRELEDDRHCPEDLYGEVHKDGEVWGAMGWNMISDPAIGPAPLAAAIYGAAADWDADVNWERAGESLLDAIGDLEAAGVINSTQADGMRGHAASSGVSGCGRVARLDDGAEPTLFLVNAGLSGAAEYIPLSLQFSLDASETADRVRFRVEDLARGTDQLGYRVYVRRGQAVGHVVEVLDFLGIEVPVPTDFDWSVDGEDEAFELVLDGESEPPLEPGATYFFSVASRNLGGIGAFELATGEITVSGDVRAPEADPTPAADDDDDDVESGDGCTGCHQGDSNSHGVMVLGAVVVLLRRRR